MARAPTESGTSNWLKIPGRIERTATATLAGDPPRLRGVRLAVLLVGMGVLAAAPGLGWYFFLRGGARTVRPPDGERPGAAERKTIAVLPFTNMSSDKADEYFSDGMTEELINALANIDGLHVSSRTSVFALNGKKLDARQIGDKLNVKTLLEGSVRREGNTLSVTAQLINVGDDFTRGRRLRGLGRASDAEWTAPIECLGIGFESLGSWREWNDPQACAR